MQLADTINNLGTAASHLGDAREAKEFYLRALSILNSTLDTTMCNLPTPSTTLEMLLRTSAMLVKQRNSIYEPSPSRNSTLDTTMCNLPAPSTTLELLLRTLAMFVKQRNSIYEPSPSRNSTLDTTMCNLPAPQQPWECCFGPRRCS